MRLVIVTLVTVLVCRAAAVDYYVSTQGRDVNQGTSIEAAWRTIARANARVASGDTVTTATTSGFGTVSSTTRL
jgi:hypothetical protein